MHSILLTSLTIFVINCNARPQINLEYKPMRPFYQLQPVGYLEIQIIPPGKPWPASPEGYVNFSQITTKPPNLEKTTTINLVDRIKEPGVVSGRPPFHPNPGDTVGPIVPPGKPWPSRPEDYGNFSQITTKPPNLEKTTTINLVDRIKEPGVVSGRPPFHPNPGDTVGPIVPPGKPWPSRPEDYGNFSQTTTKPPNLEETTTTVNLVDRIKEPGVVSGRPPFHPNPGDTVGPIVPPGKPWPSRPEDYGNFTQIPVTPPNLEDRFKETTTTINLVDGIKEPAVVSGRPPFHPNPGDTIGSIVPPGKPWPSRPEDYSNFTQIPVAPPNLEDRFKETTSASGGRPPFHPNPGNNIGQIIPPGKPWPSRPEDYGDFSQTSPKPPKFEDRIKETTLSSKPPTIKDSSTILSVQPSRNVVDQNGISTQKLDNNSEDGNFNQKETPKSSKIENGNNFSELSIEGTKTEAFTSHQNLDGPNCQFSTTTTTESMQVVPSDDKSNFMENLEEKATTLGGSPEFSTDGPLFTSAVQGSTENVKKVITNGADETQIDSKLTISEGVEVVGTTPKDSRISTTVLEDDTVGYHLPQQQPQFPFNSNFYHFQPGLVRHPGFDWFKKTPSRYFTHFQQFW